MAIVADITIVLLLTTVFFKDFGRYFSYVTDHRRNL